MKTLMTTIPHGLADESFDEPFYEWLVQENPDLCNVYMRGQYLLAQGLKPEDAAELADTLNQVLDSFGCKREDCAKVKI